MHSSSGVVCEIVDHACRSCGGRLVQHGDTYLCPTCGAQTSGTPNGICGCGLLAAGPRAKKKGGDAFHCGPNPRRGPAYPEEIVILFGDTPAVPAGGVP